MTVPGEGKRETRTWLSERAGRGFLLPCQYRWPFFVRFVVDGCCWVRRRTRCNPFPFRWLPAQRFWLFPFLFDVEEFFCRPFRYFYIGHRREKTATFFVHTSLSSNCLFFCRHSGASRKEEPATLRPNVYDIVQAYRIMCTVNEVVRSSFSFYYWAPANWTQGRACGDIRNGAGDDARTGRRVDEFRAD